MAVRDDQRPGTGDQGSRGLPWRDTLGLAPAVLLVGGLLLYAFLSICYARFYGGLGVDPNDVGFSYAGTLARSSGFVATYLILVLIGLLVFLRPKPLDRFGKHLAFFVGLTALFLMSVGPVATVSGARIAASEVMAGKAVSPIGAWFLPFHGLDVLAIHAAPATVEPAGKPSDSPAAERLRGRRLLYLGQSGGTVVLYDAATQRAVYVPGSSVILHVANCDAKPPPDPACRKP
jgi:hypothetical protein